VTSGIVESHVEAATLAWLADLGYATVNGLDIGPDGTVAERSSYGDVLLVERVRAAIAKLNPTLNAETRAAVLSKLTHTETPSLIEENRRLHRYMIEGVSVEVRRPDGSIGGEQTRLIDFDDPDANDWLAVNQYTVIENKANRRPDVVVFVNGLPLGVIELKNPGDENATLDGAFNQLQTYKAQISSLFRTDAALVISDGIAARIGSLTADRERFMPAHRDGCRDCPQGHTGTGDRAQGRFRPPPLPRSREGLHRLRRHGQRCRQDTRRLSPVPRRAEGGGTYSVSDREGW
jgi:type I restriction enzyme R subunit